MVVCIGLLLEATYIVPKGFNGTNNERFPFLVSSLLLSQDKCSLPQDFDANLISYSVDIDFPGPSHIVTMTYMPKLWAVSELIMPINTTSETWIPPCM